MESTRTIKMDSEDIGRAILRYLKEEKGVELSGNAKIQWDLAMTGGRTREPTPTFYGAIITD